MFRSIAAAFSFLTVIPVPQAWTKDEKCFASSIHWFPVIGLFIGLLSWLLACSLPMLLPSQPTAFIIVMFPALISGGLHLDGLADTADAFFSSRTKGRMLEIMHDSNIGAMGVLALVFAIGLKFAIIISLPLHLVVTGALLAPMIGRCAFAAMIVQIPYAREDGLGGIYWSRKPILLLLPTILVIGLPIMILGVEAGICLASVPILTAILFSMHCRRKIDGGTGDTLGALCELTSLSVWVAIAILHRHADKLS